MLKSRRVVGHDVGVAREVTGLVAVAVIALVHARYVAQGRCWPFGGDSTFVHSTDRRGVVTPGTNGGVPDLVIFGLDGQLPEDSRVLKVTVGDRARRVVLGHKSPLHLVVKGVSPDIGSSF